MRRPYYGWIVVLACFLGTFVVFGLSYSFGVFLDRMLEEFGRSRGATTVAFGVQTLLIYVGAVAVGVFVDRHGARRTLLAAAVIVPLGLVLTSRATSLLAVVVAFGVVTGFGLSLVYVVSYATVPRWFDRRLGLAGGVASSGLGVGMLVVAPASSRLIDRVGWRTAFLLLAGVAAVVLVVAAFLIRDEPAPESAPASEFPDGFDGAASHSLRATLTHLSAVARSGPFLLVVVGWVLIYATLYVVFVHLVVHATDVGLTRTTGAAALGLVGLASALGRIAIGHLADRIGRVRVFVGCSATMGAATIALPAFESAAGFVAFALVYGLAYGGNGALLAPLIADTFGRANLNAIFGLASGAFAASGLASPYLAGAAHDVLGTYDHAFVASGFAALLGALAIALAHRRASR